MASSKCSEYLSFWLTDGLCTLTFDVLYQPEIPKDLIRHLARRTNEQKTNKRVYARKERKISTDIDSVQIYPHRTGASALPLAMAFRARRTKHRTATCTSGIEVRGRPWRNQRSVGVEWARDRSSQVGERNI